MYIPIDYEFCRTKNRYMDVVSVAYEVDGEVFSDWLYKDKKKQAAHVAYLNQLHDQGAIFVAHNAQAEMRAMISCGVHQSFPFRFIDTFLEYRCITNSNDRLMWGKQLINGKEVVTKRPKYGEEATVQNQKPQHNLASCTYKLLGIKIDTDHKNTMRDLIISAPDSFTPKEQEAILKYGESDVVHLNEILIKILEEFKFLLGEKFNSDEIFKEMLLRGDYARRSAIMETIGYPINYEATKNFSSATKDILSEVARDINNQFPDIKPFSFLPRENRFKMNTKNIKEWVAKSKYSGKWMKTKTGYSLAKDAFGKFYDYNHDYPRDNFGAQMVRYLKTKQSLNGFSTANSTGSTFWDYVGDDKRVRAHLNPYGSQTARTQPAATGMLFLKAAWMRSLAEAPRGRALAGLDYGSQEILISACHSLDDKLAEAYASGDVYLHFAKEIGLVPPNGTKKTHPVERQVCKSTVLGISYSMTEIGLAPKLRNDLKDETITERYAKSLINKFNRTYKKFYKWKQSITGRRGYVESDRGTLWEEVDGLYQKQGYLKLPCGWYIWGDQSNPRSVGNFLVQGTGSSILRKAVSLAQDSGLSIPLTLHDAVYLEYTSFDWDRIKVLREAMVDAFTYYFEGQAKDFAKYIRVDAETWSRDYAGLDDKISLDGLEVKVEEIHIDERSLSEYERFKKYFKKDEDILDL